MICTNCKFQYSDDQTYCPKCGENNYDFRFDRGSINKSESNHENKIHSNNVYNALRNLLEKLHEDGIHDGETDIDHTFEIIDDIINKSLGNKNELNDYLLFYDPWKERDRLFETTKRRTYVFFHEKLYDVISNLNDVTTHQDPIEYIYQEIDDQMKKDLNLDELLLDSGEVLILGYNDHFRLFTYQNKDADYVLNHKYRNMLITFKLDNAEILENINQYYVCMIDEYYHSDSYIFIPLNTNSDSINLNNECHFIKDETSNVIVGIDYGGKFYSRKDIWMSFNDRDLNDFTIMTAKEFLKQKYIEDTTYD